MTNGSGTTTANVTSVQVTCTTVTRTVGGTVSNLVGTGLQLQDNGGDTLSVNANGPFIFSTALDDGSAYAVTVSTQPSSPSQTCSVANGTGTATADVTNVLVDCAHNEWTWVGGSDVVNQSGFYGILGAPTADNIPGARYGGAAWTDPSGNKWLFGGAGYDSAGTYGSLNDLWRFSGGKWTWMGGSNVINQAGTYGTLGIPAADNIPGARYAVAAWTDASGGLWLFGGYGYDSAGGTLGGLNDLWKYSGGQWTWMGGSDVVNQKGTYGTLGTPAVTNVPGARAGEVSWTDASGNLWLFGGVGYDSAGAAGELNDVWMYHWGEWTWMGGSKVVSQKGTYGILGTPAAANTPGGREGAMTWTDASGNVWLFGGAGYDSAGTFGHLNDLWKYRWGEWTWMGGSNLVNHAGSYGTLGAAAASNVPGARDYGMTWTDASGKVWLFGGSGYDSVGTPGRLNDLWKYDGGQWTWMGGSAVVNQQGTYGTGTPYPGNIPGARFGSAAWTDASGNLWLFGGVGYDSAGAEDQLNDLWMFEP